MQPTASNSPPITRPSPLAPRPSYIGFGFGAIQAGLFLYEAWRSGNFDRLVVAEVMAEVVEAVRANGGYFGLNIAHADHVEQVQVGPIDIYNPAIEADRTALLAAIGEAQELGTAVPSVNFYASDSPGSIHRLLAAGLRQHSPDATKRWIIYTAENNNHAAEILEERVRGLLTEAEWQAIHPHVCFVNTVIRKMCGIQPASAELVPIAPTLPRAFLVEAFNHILISQIHFAGADTSKVERGLSLFEEKSDLLPFEEAKLYTLNGLHAIGAYLGIQVGLRYMFELSQHPQLLALLRAIAYEEVGTALMRKYAGVDALFRHEEFARFVDDYIQRMVNPYLKDTVERVGRDPARKLSWEDRLVGAMRLCLQQGVEPARLAIGVAAALQTLAPDSTEFPIDSLIACWKPAASYSQDEAERLLGWVAQGWERLWAWRKSSFQTEL